MATSGRTASMLSKAQIARTPADHPLLGFPRAYFAAKERLYGLAALPEKTAGRALARY